MRSKLVLLLFVAVLGSAALVASAQDTIYTIDAGQSADKQRDTATKNLFVARQLNSPAPRPGAVPKGGFYTVYGAGGQPAFLTLTGEEAGLAQQAEQLGQQLAAAKSDSDREKIKGQLAEILEKQFDQRQKRHEEEIKSLEAQVKKLKDLVDKRQENRREIVSARLNQIVKEAQGLGW